MSLIKKNAEHIPLRSMLTDLFDANSFFGSDLTSLKHFFVNAVPPANVKELDHQFEVELAVPGYSKGDFNININNDVLTISAEKKDESNEKNANFTRKEFSYQSFERSFTLPNTVEGDRIKAEYKEGLLQLVIPKRDAVSTKKEIVIQ